jgi:hypothetical protein
VPTWVGTPHDRMELIKLSPSNRRGSYWQVSLPMADKPLSRGFTAIDPCYSVCDTKTESKKVADLLGRERQINLF